MKEEETEDNEEEPSEERAITIDRTIHFPMPQHPPLSHHNTSLLS